METTQHAAWQVIKAANDILGTTFLSRKCLQDKTRPFPESRSLPAGTQWGSEGPQDRNRDAEPLKLQDQSLPRTPGRLCPREPSPGRAQARQRAGGSAVL